MTPTPEQLEALVRRLRNDVCLFSTMDWQDAHALAREAADAIAGLREERDELGRDRDALQAELLQQHGRIEAAEAENAKLREAIKAAYLEGFRDGAYNYAATEEDGLRVTGNERLGLPEWETSDARAIVAKHAPAAPVHEQGGNQ